MNIPLWKRWLSYLYPIQLDAWETDIHPELNLDLSRGRFQLSTPNAIYSFEDLYVNFARAFQRINLDKLPNKEVLVLGLGLGSVIQLLEQKHHFQGEYTAIEHDEFIAQIAQDLVLSKIDAPITYYNTDAVHYLQMEMDASFGLVVLDIFQDDQIPDYFKSQECLADITDKLHPKGLVLTNRLYNRPKDRLETDQYTTMVFMKQFPKGGFIDIKGNRILLSDHQYLKSS
jgi:hypothetical protein